MPSLVSEASQAKGTAGSLSLNPILSATGVKGKQVTALTKECGMYDLIESIIADKPDMDSSFCVLDLGVVMELMDKWVTKFPTVQPFYAIKCNPDLSLIGTLAALGSSFDCASKAEIETVLSLGVSPDRIVCANPCKSESDIKYAATVGVNLATYDSVYEIDKVRKWHPKCELLLRIKYDSGARASLGVKYGALPEEIPELLEAAKVAGLKVTGVSFHIGSGGADPRALPGAIAAAKSVFDTACSLGMSRMRILDIGGGFTCGPELDIAVAKVNSAIQTYFKDYEDLVVIAEPGRYFTETVFTLASRVIGKRVRGELREYWINDGVYGSISNIIYDHATITCAPHMRASRPENPLCVDAKTYPTTVFGPTCDCIDIVLKDYRLPELQVNDWLVFPNMGAYTISSGTNFNGFTSASKHVYLGCSSPYVREENKTMF